MGREPLIWRLHQSWLLKSVQASVLTSVGFREPLSSDGSCHTNCTVMELHRIGPRWIPSVIDHGFGQVFPEQCCGEIIFTVKTASTAVSERSYLANSAIFSVTTRTHLRYVDPDRPVTSVCVLMCRTKLCLSLHLY